MFQVKMQFEGNHKNRIIIKRDMEYEENHKAKESSHPYRYDT